LILTLLFNEQYFPRASVVEEIIVHFSVVMTIVELSIVVSVIKAIESQRNTLSKIMGFISENVFDFLT